MAKQPDSNQPRPSSTPLDPTSMDSFSQKIVVSVPDLKLAEQQPRLPNPMQNENGGTVKTRLDTIAPSQLAQPQRQPSKRDWIEVPDIDQELADQDEISVTDRIHRNRKPLSSVLISTIAHTILFVILALVVFAPARDDAVVLIVAQIDATPAPEESQTDIEKIEIIAENSAESPIEMNAEDLANDSQELAPQEQNSLLQLPSSFINPSQASEVEPAAPNQLFPSGGGLKGRDAEARARMATTRGGSRASEEAVERGLLWIINHQYDDGSWRLNHTGGGQCGGRCQDPGTIESTTAATGLALLALLGAGYTQEVGPYQTEIQHGLDYLVGRMRVTRYGGNLAESTMYAQGIATLALSEAYIMTRDPTLKEPVEQAMTYIISAQHSAGGWRYNPGSPGDMTVTGWMLMALKSCSMGGFEIPRETISKAKKFLDSKGESGGAYYGYLKSGIEPSPTAIGLLCQMYLGWPKERGALQTGAERLADWGPSQTDVYFDYYATQVLHHLDSELWKDWNLELRDYLVKAQDRSGHQDGSWFFMDKNGKTGGRLYTTAMSVMVLEVYYRYLPLYDERAVD